MGVLFVLIAWGSGYRPHCVTGSMVVIALLASVACVALGPFAEKAFGKKDPGEVTIDEWAGQAVTYVLLPLGAGLTGAAITAGAGFLVFRILDIIKPPPARWLEKLPDGWGVLADDLAAGLYANLICQLILRVWMSLEISIPLQS